MVTIKKYPNRRLYDTSKSQYVNLEAIKELVMLHQEFEVIDSKSGEDLTKSILLQIISEQEGNEQQALLTQSVLKQLIRFYGSDLQVFMRQYLEQSIATFLDRQDALQGVMQEFMDVSPLNVFNQLMEQNLSMWGAFPKAGFSGGGKSSARESDTDATSSASKPAGEAPDDTSSASPGSRKPKSSK